jgi:hypothetical protein
MRLFKTLGALSFVVLVWCVDGGYVTPTLQEATFGGVLFALCPVLFCFIVTILALAYIITVLV